MRPEVVVSLLTIVTVDAIRSLALSTDSRDNGDGRAVNALPANYSAYLHAFDLVERRMKEPEELRREREEAFWKRHRLATVQNAKLQGRWRAAASHLFDATEGEMRAMMGYKPSLSHRHQGLNFLSTHEEALNLSVPQGLVLPEAMDWRQRVTSSNLVRSQGSCGSCWAISSTNALEMHLEIYDPQSVGGHLALEQMILCTPNKRHCGGQGGCTGATAELAFQFVKDKGLSFQDDQPALTAPACEGPPIYGRRVVTSGFVRLPPNKALPLQYALAVKGPVVVSADAAGWETYGGGVYDNCPRNAAVNHAVLAVGYGKSAEGKYWIIRNSWGPEWGEDGHMRLLRVDDSDRDAAEAPGHCGIDYHPQEGVACEGETAPVPVCGMCGILFDSSFPVGVAVTSGHGAMKLRSSK